MTIRRQPSDFLVREVPTSDWLRSLSQHPTPAHRHACFELTKVSLTTPEALGRLCKALGARIGTASYAGLKDRHARTTQHVSVVGWSPRGDEPAEWREEAWSARAIGWSDQPIQAAAIDRNDFEIVVRDLSHVAATEMERRAALLADGSGLLVVNYFGDQRFGSARHGEGFAARHLVRGEFEQALKLLIATPARKDSGVRRGFTRAAAARWGEWEVLAGELPRCPEKRAIESLACGRAFRDAFAALPMFLQQISVEAYQSHLWNEVARALVEPLTPALSAADAFGPMAFPAAASVPPAMRSLVVPLLSPETPLAGPSGAAAAGVLAREGLGLGDLRIPGLRRPVFGSAPRALFAIARSFALSPIRPDDLGRRSRRTVSFALPRGAYATVVLRALGQ